MEEYGVDSERDIADLTDMDRKWAAACAGREVTDAEAAEFKREYEDWIDSTLTERY